MTTIEDRLPELAATRPPEVITDWMAALKYLAVNRTATRMRSLAEAPGFAEGLAKRAGTDPALERAMMLAIAGAMDQLTASGNTPEKCWRLARLDLEYGPYMPRDEAGYVAAALLAAGHSFESLPESTHPAVADMVSLMTAAGVTRQEAALIAEAGQAPARAPFPPALSAA